MIVVFGPDGAGKTTFVSSLKERGFIYYAKSPGPIPKYQEYYSNLMSSLEEKNGLPFRVHERFVFDELIFGPILRDRLLVTREFLEEFLERTQRYLFFVMVLPPFEIALKNVLKTKKQQWPNVVEKYKEIYDSFVVIYYTYVLSFYPSVLYDYTESSFNIIYALCERHENFLLGGKNGR